MLSKIPVGATELEDQLSVYSAPFERALADRHFDIANRIAMLAAERLLKQNAEAARSMLWQHIFSKLDVRYRTQYQCYDFEIADYEMYPAIPKLQLFRGPQPDATTLASGRYITMLGAAQLFGRFQPVGPHTAVAKELRIPVLNLSMGGAGPETFGPKFLRIANGGQAVVLQVLSGRSIGCDEYPGGRITRRHGDGQKVSRLTVLKETWNNSPHEATRLVCKWQQNYIDTMSRLVAQFSVPVVLIWVSTREPDAWSIDLLEKHGSAGDFPQLVDRNMVEEVAGKCTRYVEISSDPGLPYPLVSRFTGEPCPRFFPDGRLGWQNGYYPSSLAGLTMVNRLTAALRSVLDGPAPAGANVTADD